MRYVRWGAPGEETPGLLDASGALRDLSTVIEDLAGHVLGDLPKVDANNLPVVSGYPRLGPPVAGDGKLIGFWLYITVHALLPWIAFPQFPFVFMKATSSICGPDDDVILPRGATQTDWEVELGVGIGRTAKNITKADALAHVAGFTIVNDVSERGWQFDRGGQWVKGKSADTFAPTGPWLVTPEDIAEVQDLALSLTLNGKEMQTGSTARMVFDVAETIAYLSTLMSLHPGDIIATGTPPGVGMGQNPKRFLKDGDEMRLAITSLGTQHQRVRQAE